MKIEKYVFFLGEALRLAAIRLNLSRPLNHSDLTVLYTLRYYGTHKYEAIIRRVRTHYNPMSRTTLTTSLNYLKESSLIEYSQPFYSISPLGREYLSYVRRYMLNRRL